MNRILAAGVVLLLLVAPALAVAQEQRGSIEGTIRDDQGGVLPGATVEARSPRLVGVQATVTDERGAYRFPTLVPGVYELTVTLSGFQTLKQGNIVLELGRILKVDLVLKVASVSETVNVNADAPLIDVKQNAAGVNVDSAVIDRIPKGRDFTTVVTVAPGISNEDRNRGLQMDGGSGADNRFVVDGVDTTNIANGLSQRRVAPDFIQEVQAKSSGYSAEYRASIGGVLNVITKSGGNAFHGSAGMYFTNDNMQGTVRPFLRLNPADQTKSEYVTTPDDQYWTGEWVGDVGGPIKREKLWFYVGYNPQYTNRERTVVFTRDRAAGPKTFSSLPFDSTINSNLVGQISKSLRAKFSMSNGRTHDGDALPSINTDGTSNDNPSLYPPPNRLNRFSDSYAGTVDWVVNNTTYMNVTTTYMRYGGEAVGTFSDKLQHIFSTSNLQYPDIPADLQHLQGYQDYPSSNRQVRDTWARLNFNADVSKYFRFKGQHSLKAGVQVEHLTNDVLSGAQAPRVRLYYGRSYASNDGNLYKGKYGYFQMDRLYTTGDVSGENIAFFIQDAWSLNDRFTLNVGLRDERETSPSYNPSPYDDIKFGFGDKIGPRIGFAWDIKGNSAWKAYGSYGVFYDLLKMTLGRVMLGGDKWMNYFYTLDEPDFNKVGNCGDPPDKTGTSCGGKFVEQFDYRPVANDPNLDLVDPNLKPIQLREFTLGIDHELTPTTSVGVRYAHKWIVRALEAICYIDDTFNEVCGDNNPGFGTEYPAGAKYPNGASLGLWPFGPTMPPQPKAVRDYDSLEFHLRKRFSKSWSLDTSYMWSRLFGNWSGIASSDEAVGGLQPYSGRSFNLLYYSYDASGRESTGLQATDRPHQFKLQGTYEMPWGTVLGLNFRAVSGTPWSTVMVQNNMAFFPFGRGDIGRTPAFTQVDLLLQQEFRLGGNKRVSVGLNMTNLFDQDQTIGYYPNKYQTNLNISNQKYFAGFNPDAEEAAAGGIADPQYRLKNQFQARRSVLFQAKLMF